MGVVVEGGACGWSKRAAQGVFRRWEAQLGVSGSSGAAGAGPWAARSHSTTRTLLPPQKTVIGFEFGPNCVLIRSGDLELP